METGLTLSEQQELNNLSDAFNLNSELKEIAEKLLIDFKTKIGSPYYGQKPLLAINCAVLVAFKSNYSQPLENQGKLGESPLITQVVKRLTSSNNNVSIEEFLGVLKQFISAVPLPDETTIKLKNIINKFAFSYTFFIKYQKLFKQLELQEFESENYVNYLKNFVWLVYITARDSILHGHVELVEAVFLLISTLTHMLFNLPNEVKILYCEKNGKHIYENGSQKKSEELAQEIIFELLTPNSTPSDDIASYYKTFQDFLTKIVKEKVIVSMGGDNDNKSIYSQELLIANFNKLDEYYQKGLRQDDLDERFYIYDNKTMAPGKFTPFAKQGSANKLNINVSVLKEDGEITERSQKSYSSHQLSDYKSSKQVTLGSNLRDIKSTSRSIPMSPFGQSQAATSVPSTPMTIALEMYNWLSDKVKLKKNDAGLPPTLDKYLSTLGGKYRDEIINRANGIIDNVLSPEKENLMHDQNPFAQKKLKDKQNQILNLYFKILEDLLVREEKKTKRPQYYEILKNEDFHKALVACAIETVFFVNNYSNLTFTKLLELCKIQPFEFWRIIASFIKSDAKMPLPIKKHFYELELKILMHLVWKKESVVHQIVQDFIDAQKPQGEEQQQTNGNGNTADETEKEKREQGDTQKMIIEEDSKKPALTHSQELFFKRVLHHTAFQVYQLCDLLKLDETISEQVWTTIKHILSSQTSLLIERHIGQLILCCIYAVCKINRRPMKFQEIIAKCQELAFFNKDDFAEIVHQVYITDNERADLIKFYNTIFMGPMKSFICSLGKDGKDQKPNETKQSSTPLSKPLVPQLVLDSPLKEFIPQQIMYSGVPTPDPKSAIGVKGGWTPQTKALYAFGESPCRALETINKYASKRPVESDDSQDSFLPGSVLRKQVKGANSIMDKIIDERSVSNSMMKQMPSKRNLFGTTPNPTGGDRKVNIEEYAKPKVPNNSTSSSQISAQDKAQGSLPSSQGSK